MPIQLRSFSSSLLAGLLLLLAWVAGLFFQGLSINGLLASQALLVLALVSGLWRLDRIKLPRNTLTLALLVFALWLVFSLNWSLAPEVSRQHLWIILSLPAAFLVYNLAGLTHHKWNLLVGSFIAIACLLALNVAWQSHRGEAQLSSIFLNPNLLSALLNLVILLSSAWFLYLKQGKRTAIGLGIALFIMVYAVGLVQSRGAILCLLAALLLLVIVCRQLLNRVRLLYLVAIIAFGLLISTIEIHQSIATPIEVVISGERIDQGRLAIWGPSWELVKHSPWVGSGLGLFWLLYPQVRHATENSGGNYAHNDYLQLWIEAGLPAVILLVAILLSTLMLYIRIMRTNENPQGRLEASGLFFGLLAVATHSMVTFNFYILSILILCGIYLGRLNQLSGSQAGATFTLQRPPILNQVIFRGLLLIAALFPLVLIANEGLAKHSQRQATVLKTNNDFIRANAALHRARKYQHSDALLLDHAGLYYRVLQILPVSDKQRRNDLFTDSLRLLKKAERLNPLRSQLYVLRGQLYAEHPDLAGSTSGQLARESFSKAISLNPRNLRARFGMAHLYLNEENRQAALNILDEGLRHHYYTSVEILPYLQLYRQLEPGKDAAISPQQLESSIALLMARKAAENLTISE